MRSMLIRSGAGAALMLVVLVVVAPLAAAHEARTVAGYALEVGFVTEPVYAGQPNGVFLSVSDASGKAVTDLGESLKVEVVFGDQKLDARPFEPLFGEGEGVPGAYHMSFFPTRPGKYTFHLVGAIHGQTVDASFTSSPTGFDEVREAADDEFPAKDPSNAQLAQRVDRMQPRVDTAVRSARNAATLAGAIAIAGVILGVAGIVLATRKR